MAETGIVYKLPIWVEGSHKPWLEMQSTERPQLLIVSRDLINHHWCKPEIPDRSEAMQFDRPTMIHNPTRKPTRYAVVIAFEIPSRQ
jgi:hypothetical protein